MRELALVSYPRLSIPTSQETAIFRAFDRVLQNDPLLSTTIQTYLSWSGTIGDTWEPALSLCPYLRISPFPTSSEWATEIQHRSPQTIHLEVAIQGTRFDELGNLWGLIQAALFPQNDPVHRDAVRTILMDAGVTKPTIRLSAFGSQVDNENNYMLIGRGSIEFGSLGNT